MDPSFLLAGNHVFNAYEFQLEAADIFVSSGTRNGLSGLSSIPRAATRVQMGNKTFHSLS